MERRLFLKGPSGCGKTTMIRNALGEKLAGAGGFVTERVLLPDGALAGFDLCPAAAAAGVEGFSPARFLDYSVRPPVSDNEVFRSDAVRLLREAEYYPFAVLDEFGGFELLIPQFRAALGVFLSGSVPCLGVLKGGKNAEALRRSLGLGEKFGVQYDLLRQTLSADADTLVLETTGRGDDAAAELVRRWVGEYAV